MAKDNGVIKLDTQEQFSQKDSRNLQYDFTAVEINELAVELANKNQEVARMEMEKKSVVARYKANIDLLSEQVNDLSNKVASGYEYRDVECEVIFNQPKNGQKTFIRSDTSKSFTEKMTDTDYNLFTQPISKNEEL